MKISQSAITAILHVMRTHCLDPQKWFMEIRISRNGSMCLGFTDEYDKNSVMKLGDLTIMVDSLIRTDDITIDFGEIDGKKGLFFK